MAHVQKVELQKVEWQKVELLKVEWQVDHYKKVNFWRAEILHIILLKYLSEAFFHIFFLNFPLNSSSNWFV